MLQQVGGIAAVAEGTWESGYSPGTGVEMWWDLQKALGLGGVPRAGRKEKRSPPLTPPGKM